MKKSLIDIGLNLTHKSFNSDREDVIQRALDAGVGRMILTGTCLEKSKQAMEFAKLRSGVFSSTAGVHPHDVTQCDNTTLNELKKLAKEDEVVAIGECGLDFFRNFSPRETQEKWFEAQLKLAAELGMPVFLHERDSHERFVEILQRHISGIPSTVVHCFTGEDEALHDYLSLGCFIGITGWICDERRGMRLREQVKQIPLDRMMVETDAPYLLPRDLKPKPKHNRNEPAYLPHIVTSIAHCMDKPFDEVAHSTTINANRFFGVD